MLHVLFLLAATAAPQPPVIENEELTIYARVDERAHIDARLDAVSEQPSYVQIRPMLVYRWKQFQAAIGTSWINHYQSQYAGTRAYTETRPFVRARITQPATYGSHYEQIEFQIRRYDNSRGEAQRVPRLVLRYGQSYLVGTRPLDRRIQRLNFYQELALRFAGGGAGWDYARIWAMYQIPLSAMRLEVGVRAQQSIKTSGESPNLTFGPQVQLTIGGNS